MNSLCHPGRDCLSPVLLLHLAASVAPVSLSFSLGKPTKPRRSPRVLVRLASSPSLFLGRKLNYKYTDRKRRRADDQTETESVCHTCATSVWKCPVIMNNEIPVSTPLSITIPYTLDRTVCNASRLFNDDGQPPPLPPLLCTLCPTLLTERRPDELPKRRQERERWP